MPELPEVETMCRGIRPIEGRRIVDVCRPPCARKPIQIVPRLDRLKRRTRGRSVDRVERLGKRVVLVLDSGARLVFEPRMTGLVLLESPPTIDHLRFELVFAGGAPKKLRFWDRRGLGRIQLFSERQYQTLLASGKLGPDALDVQVVELRRLLGHRRTPVKVALMNQAYVAGIGNLYASEILHRAGVDPRCPCRRLSARRWQRIHDAIQDVLTEAIHYEGSTLSDGTYRNALNDPGGYQNHHRVYDRAGERCRTCDRGHIVRIVQSQRSTFYCPRCQK